MEVIRKAALEIFELEVLEPTYFIDTLSVLLRLRGGLGFRSVNISSLQNFKGVIPDI